MRDIDFVVNNDTHARAHIRIDKELRINAIRLHK